MPIGVQLGNLNKYRRYPFVDNADTTCIVSRDGTDYTGKLHFDFLQSFRLVYAGVSAISRVNLVNIEVSRSALYHFFSFGFKLFDSNGLPVKFLFHGVPLPLADDILKLELKTSVHLSPGAVVRVFSISDFDFSNCISVCMKLDLFELHDRITEIAPGSATEFSVSCNIQMSPTSLISLKSPHVLSIADDVGEIVKDKDSMGLVAGYNVKFDVVRGTNAIVVSAIPGAGAGPAYCESGVSPSFSGATVKKINGVQASPTGGIQLSGGNGVSVQPIPGTNIINIYSNLEDKKSAECKMS